MSRELVEKVVVRRVADIIDGTRTGNHRDGGQVKKGWAMGRHYEDGAAPYSADFEIKEWGSERRYGAGTSTFRPTWHAHDTSGSEYIRVIAGKLTVFLGEKADPNQDEEDQNVRQLDVRELSAGESIVLPAGLPRRFAGDDDVLALTVRKGR